MRIGVDIDGVLNDISAWHLAFGAKYCSDHQIDRGIRDDEYYVKDVFSLTQMEADDFWFRYNLELIENIPSRPFASEVLERLRSEGHKIVILTARNNDYLRGEYAGKMDDYVILWLEKEHIPYDEIVTGSIHKATAAQDLALDLMIEDKLLNILEVSAFLPVLCFDQLHNRTIRGRNITRVYAWPQVYDWVHKRNPIGYLENHEEII